MHYYITFWLQSEAIQKVVKGIVEMKYTILEILKTGSE